MIPYKIYYDQKAEKLRIALPEGLSLVEEYLEVEVISELSKKTILDRIKKVNSGVEEVSDGMGNLYSSEIRKNVTRIYNSYVEAELKEGIDTGEECESFIETKLLADLVSIWIDARIEFRKQRSATDNSH
ncbi:hypothetical protein [Brevibacillus porteri]|uniref:hypothetical protein n=1 Tax=Brevibacillus porteri TaxID=2126350 RepID=UPI00362F994F